MAFSFPDASGVYDGFRFVVNGEDLARELRPENGTVAAAFFAFHLLFSYLADHLRVAAAFALSSAVSVFLVVTYMRLVVSVKFALLEVVSQIVFLIGFSLAHFWKGYTGLTVTVLSILTLFVLMQLTGRIRWATVGSSPPARPAT